MSIFIPPDQPLPKRNTYGDRCRGCSRENPRKARWTVGARPFCTTCLSAFMTEEARGFREAMGLAPRGRLPAYVWEWGS